MSLLFLIPMLLVGFVASYKEIKTERTSKILVFLFIVLFVCLSVSRVSHTQSYFDLTSYVRYFIEKIDNNYSVGYVAILWFVRSIWGNNAYILIAVIAIIEIFFVSMAIYVLTSENNKRISIKNGVILIKKKVQDISCHYFITTLLVYVAYWGIVFSCEGLRSGLGSTCAMLAIAFAIKEKYPSSLLLFIFSCLFHVQELILITIYILIAARNRSIKKHSYILWFAIIILLDISVNLLQFNPGNVIAQIASIFSKLIPGLNDSISNIFKYMSEGMVDGNYFSTQYVFYRILALAMLFGNLTDEKYKTVVSLYYSGLTLSAIFQYFVVFGRVQNTFLCIIALAFLLWCRNDTVTKKNQKIFVVSVYTLLQVIMVIRYLGVRI